MTASKDSLWGVRAREFIAQIGAVQARQVVIPSDPGALGEEPGERVVTADLDERRAAEEEDRRWRQWP
jgi:hypothetical protein